MTVPPMASLSVKDTGLAQKLGQLEAVNRDLQAKSWANLQLLGQPCNFPALYESLQGESLSAFGAGRRRGQRQRRHVRGVPGAVRGRSAPAPGGAQVPYYMRSLIQPPIQTSI